MGKSKIASGRKLVVLSGSAKGTAFVLTKPEVKAGRESDNAICLKGKRVSRHHAVLVRDNGEYTLRDMSPRIGTLLNGRRTKEAHLKVGDRIRIGEFEMSYEATTAPVMDAPPAMTPAPVEEVVAPVMPVVPAEKELVLDLDTENAVPEQQRLIVELTRETERLVAEAKLGNEVVESVRAQMQAQSDLQAKLTERLATVSHENIELVKLNRELQAKISDGVMSAEEARRVDAKWAQETKHLVEEARKANEAMEALRTQMQTRSDQQQAELMERFTVVSQENSRLAKRNGELQAKISKLEASAAKASRLEIELTTAQEALHKMSEKLEKARESIKQNGNAEPAKREEVPLSSFQRVVAAEPIALDQRNKIIDPSAPMEPVAVGSDEAQLVVAKRQVSEKTHEQFDSLRRTIVEKKNLRAKMTLFERFTLPFRDTARLVQEQENANPE